MPPDGGHGRSRSCESRGLVRIRKATFQAGRLHFARTAHSIAVRFVQHRMMTRAPPRSWTEWVQRPQDHSRSRPDGPPAAIAQRRRQQQQLVGGIRPERLRHHTASRRWPLLGHLETLWGGGPELTYYFGRPHHSVRPFVDGSLLFTRAVDRFSREQLEQGTSVNVRGGFNVALSPSWGLILQSGYQSDQLPGGNGDPRVSKTLGFGLTASIN